MSRRLALVAAPLVVAALVLGGCTPDTRIPAAEPQPTAAPLFASDEEALAAATAAYEEYLAVLDELLQDPRPVGSEFDLLASGEAEATAMQDVRDFLDGSIRITAPRVVGSATLQSNTATANGAEVIAYFCEDVSDVVVLDANGRTLTTSDRPDFSLWEATVTFDGVGERVTRRDFWSNEEAC